MELVPSGTRNEALTLVSKALNLMNNETSFAFAPYEEVVKLLEEAVAKLSIP